jgi:predicted ATP-dependent endonuclease of OLD family
MTRIEHFRISDFKGISEYEFDTGALNIITGRNNTGKTSILESIDIAFNPSDIRMFEENVRYLVNSESTSASINVQYTKDQSTITEFSDTGRMGRNREVGLRVPRDNEVVDYFIESLYKILDLNSQYPLPNLSDILQTSNEKANEIVQDRLEQQITSIPAHRVLGSGMSERMLILEVNGEEYPFVYCGREYSQIREDLVRRTVQSLMDDYQIDIQSTAEKDIVEDLVSSVDRLLAPRFGSMRAVGGEPEGLANIKFIEEITGKRDDFDLSMENSAVRTNKIENYLIENDIISGLQDFSFDKVVIQEDDSEPYEVPYQFLGSGVKILIKILWVLFDNRNTGHVLLLEEPEAHMHPGYIEKMVGYLVDISMESGIQLFMTTHNMDLIDAFFSPQMEGPREEFLREQFHLIQLTGSASKNMDYDTSQLKLDELNLDLRGV